MLEEPFTGVWDRRGNPVVGDNPRLSDILKAVGEARPCREKIGPMYPMPDDLIWVLPPGSDMPALSTELLLALADAEERGNAICVWGDSPLAVARAKLAFATRGCVGRA